MKSLPYPGKAQCPYPPPPPLPGHPVANVIEVGNHELLDPGEPVSCSIFVMRAWRLLESWEQVSSSIDDVSAWRLLVSREPVS